MPTDANIIIVGASARAAAFSALRADLRPWCVDLFADEDLRALCPGTGIPHEGYPHGLPDLLRQAPPGPWLYTGGLENHPKVLAEISRDRPLWGNSAEVLRLVRDPFHLARVFRNANVPFPEVRQLSGERSPARRWLVKPRFAAGGAGIAFWRPSEKPSHRRVYYQEFLDGPSWSAVYVGTVHGALLLGLSRQLVGEPWLHARPFHYCGSISPPTDVTRSVEKAYQRIGDVLAQECGVLGLFGVDCVMHNEQPWPVELNPRYTASVEVVEFTSGISALRLHRAVFEGSTMTSRSFPCLDGAVIGKAILFASRTLEFPGDGPWLEALRRPTPIDEVPSFADIPQSGQRIEAGWPVLTFFARAESESACYQRLQRTAADLERWLFNKTTTV